MKDYSEFYQNKAGFITEYKIEEKYLLVYTTSTKKNEPQKYPATKENIEYFGNRMKNQYIDIINNQEEIIKHNKNKTKIIKILLATLTTITLILSIGKLIIFSNAALVLKIFSASLSLLLITFGTEHIKENNFRKKLKEYEKFINHKEDIENRIIKDTNITTYTDKKTKTKIESSKKQKDKGQRETVLDMEFIDATPVSELRKINERYEISKSLEETPIFNIPEKQVKKLTRTKTNPKNVKNNIHQEYL